MKSSYRVSFQYMDGERQRRWEDVVHGVKSKAHAEMVAVERAGEEGAEPLGRVTVVEL